MEIGTKLRTLREAQRMTTRQIAENTGVTQSTYISWEHEKSTPSLRLLVPLSQAMKVCPITFMAYLFGQVSLLELLDIVQNVPDIKVAVTFYRKYRDSVDSEGVTQIKEELDKLGILISKYAPPQL